LVHCFNFVVDFLERGFILGRLFPNNDFTLCMGEAMQKIRARAFLQVKFMLWRQLIEICAGQIEKKGKKSRKEKRQGSIQTLD